MIAEIVVSYGAVDLTQQYVSSGLNMTKWSEFCLISPKLKMVTGFMLVIGEYIVLLPAKQKIIHIFESSHIFWTNTVLHSDFEVEDYY